MAQNLLQILQKAAQSVNFNGLLIHPSNTSDDSVLKISYAQLYEQAVLRSKRLQAIEHFSLNTVTLLHVEDRLDCIYWFWAIVAAGGVPCLSTPLPRDPDRCERHVRSLQQLLQSPLIITTEALKSEFPDIDGLRITTTSAIDEISLPKIFPAPEPDLTKANHEGLRKKSEELAVLLLTSGSTGDSKAVSLSHHNLLSSVDGKIKIHGTTAKDTFLAWTGFDHVANLVEIHLHALKLDANQVHIAPFSAVGNPLELLQRLSDHHVSYTFAPNSLLANICASLKTPRDDAGLSIDLSHLRALISGGEANTVEIVTELTRLLQEHNAQQSFIRPGLGLTESCAGAVYSVDCPSYDISQASTHCSVGYPTQAIRTRIMREEGIEAAPDEIGSLQLSGPCVFKEYYNNPEKTADSFTRDGWFKTGDLALLDKNGKLLLTGREKETIIINGNSHYLQAIENSIEVAKIPGVTPSYTVAFSYRKNGDDTETLGIVYLPTYDMSDCSARGRAERAISRCIVMNYGAEPARIPLPESCLQKSSLGKLSRKHIKDEFEKGNYDVYMIPEATMEKFDDDLRQQVANVTETIIISICIQVFPESKVAINRNTDLFSLGLSSVDILRLQSALQNTLKIPHIPHTTLFGHPVIHELGAALHKLQNDYTFSPVVVLQPHGDKTPLWLIHSGLGEVLIFMNLARYFTDRPIYAIRARGFDGEPHFTSLDELITTYHSAIKKTQPEGPYAIAGYAYGAVPAFEITKRMALQDDEIKFLGVFDQQPFSKDRVKKYDWYRVVLLLASFVGLFEEAYAISYLPEARDSSPEETLAHIAGLADQSRLRELGMTMESLDNWAKIALFMKKSISDYDPEGMVKNMDVFYTAPMPGYGPATNVEDWFGGYISKWDAFVEGGAKYHLVEGDHKTIPNPPHVESFQKLLKEILQERGL
ncbi:related to long-chain-fatty-acid CoA ligase FAA2 [Rhynchosporium agropyri]|uniref:Related to long-chain-fatty-acid CoA ligase FAA2 n=1 Tax=Rhynchosporium agropyri TaxID=914238 RepID=A0A1E1K7V6_9HELO|nr:related to long-chain-fatty-acid CoA ligase FAA2 [Rhynchosporium agropyri]